MSNSQILSRISPSANLSAEGKYGAPDSQDKNSSFENPDLQVIDISGIRAYTNLPLNEDITNMLRSTAERVREKQAEEPKTYSNPEIYLTRTDPGPSGKMQVKLEIRTNPEPVEHLRRITGYLVGTLDKFNDAKRAEERDRVKHI